MGRQPKFNEDEILDRAMTVVWQRGWSHTAIRDLEEALELKAPSIYRRFGTRTGIGVAIVDHYTERVVQRRVDRHLPGTGDPVANIVAFLETSVTQSGDDQRLWGCLLTTTSLEGSAADDALAEVLARGLDVIEQALRREIVRAQKTGSLDASIAPSAAVDMLVLTMQGLMAMARGGSPPAVLRRRARAAVSLIQSRQA